MKSAFRIFNKSQGCSTPRGIYCAKYYGQGGGNGAGEKKMKNEAVRNKIKKKKKRGKEKEEKETGESDFFG